MAATPELIARLRALVNEPTTDTYTDAQIAAAIERYPVLDRDGHEPGDADWTEGYDMPSAAADIWEEKAAIVAQDYDFTAPRDDGAYQRSQVYKQYMAQVRYYRSRRNLRTIRVLGAAPPAPSIVANWNDPFA